MNDHQGLRIAAAVSLWALLAPAFAQTVKPALQPLDVFGLQWVGDPQVAPDGRSIAYVRMSFDIKTDRQRGVIWLVGADGKHARPLPSAASSSSPRWSPDGTRLAYLGKAADGSTQLFVYWGESNTTAAISNFTESPAGLAWSQDGRWIAFTMPVAAERKPLKVELPETPKGAQWAEPPKLIDRMVFRVDGEGYLPNVFSQLFIIAADGGAVRQLTHGDFDHQGTPAFTADGKSVLVAANRRADADYEPLDTEIYRVELSDDSIHALTDRRGPDHHPVVSPDGKYIAYLGFDDERLGYQATQLYVMDADGRHSHSLTPALDRDAANPHWTGDSRQLMFQYDDHGTIKIAAIDLAGKMQILAADVGGSDVTRPYSGGSFSVAAAGKGSSARFAYTKAAPQAPASLATGTSARDIVTLTALSGPLFEERTLGAVEEISFDSAVDHRRIQGWIVKPPGFD
jgi:acylaminoacyl-peptidase